MKIIALFISLFFFVGCDVSSLSEGKLSDISKLKFAIYIHDGGDAGTLNQIKVHLSDGEKQVVNEHITVLVNDIPMELFVKQELYYTTTSYYRTDHLTRKESYYFEVILPDSSRHPVAYIRPKNTPNNNRFEIAESFDANQDFVFRWDQLDRPHRLEIIKGVTVKRKPEDNITEHRFSGRIIDTLTRKQGEYVLPKSYFDDSLETTNYIDIEVTRFENGLTNPKLHPKSSINYDFSFEKVVSLQQ